MWSLPDIQRINSEAHINRRKLQQASRTDVLNGERVPCEHGENCQGPLFHELWYDIFSDDPKGIVTQCEFHRDQYGTPEGFFWCDGCCRLIVENYTWELYSTTNTEGEKICLRCAAEEYIADDDNWIALTGEDIAVITFEVVRGARHVLSVRMPVPTQISVFDIITLDSSTGGLVRGFTYADPTPDQGVETLRDILNRAKDAGHHRALLILDGAYQFATSIGVYVPATVESRSNGNRRTEVR